MFGCKSKLLSKTDKEMEKAQDIVEIVRGLRVIRRSPYFEIKVNVSSDDGEEEHYESKVVPIDP